MVAQHITHWPGISPCERSDLPRKPVRSRVRVGKRINGTVEMDAALHLNWITFPVVSFDHITGPIAEHETGFVERQMKMRQMIQ